MMEPSLVIQLSIAAVLQLALYLLFGRFVQPHWKAYPTIGFYLLISWILARSLGWWGLIWIVGHPAMEFLAHLVWCGKNGIDWQTCEPREQYLRLRAWTLGDELANADRG